MAFLHQTNEHAWFVGLAADAQSVRSADGLSIFVHSNQSHRVDARYDPRDESDGADNALEVDWNIFLLKVSRFEFERISVVIPMLDMPSVAP